jgi:hypothetical protein
MMGKREGRTDSRLGFSNLRKLHHACSLGTRPIKQYPASSTWPVVSNSSTRSSFVRRPRQLKSQNPSFSYREFISEARTGRLTLRTMICRLGSTSYAHTIPAAGPWTRISCLVSRGVPSSCSCLLIRAGIVLVEIFVREARPAGAYPPRA